MKKTFPLLLNCVKYDEADMLKVTMMIDWFLYNTSKAPQ